MVVRNVEGKLPYTGGKAITVNPNTKVISLNLRDENNLIIYDSGDNEIYVDLQLPDGILPNYAFPVGITTGRVLVADGWDVTGTIIVARTTSGDIIKLVYGDNGKLFIDNGSGLFKQIYLAPEVDALLATKQDKLIAGENIVIGADGRTISAIMPAMSTFLSLWDCSTGEPISFPASIPYEYKTGDHFMVEIVSSANPAVNYRPSGTAYDGSPSSTVETAEVEVGDVYIYDGSIWLLQKNNTKEVSFANIAGQPSDNAALDAALDAKQDVLTAGDGISISNNVISNTGVLSSNNTYDNIIHLSQADYDGLSVKDPETLYSTPDPLDSDDLNTKTFELTGTTGQDNLDTAQSIYNWYSLGKNPLILYNNYIYVLANATTSMLTFRGRLSQENQNSSSFIKQDVIKINMTDDTVTSIATDVVVVGGSFLRLGQNYTTPYNPTNDGDPTSKKYVDEHGAAIPVYYLNGGFSSNITFNVLEGGEYRLYVTGYHGNTIDKTLTLTVDSVAVGTYTSNLMEHYFAHMNFTATAGSTAVLTVSSTSNFSITEVYVEKVNIQSGYLTATVN